MMFRPAHAEDIQQVVRLERLPEFRAFVGTWSEEQHRATLASTNARYFVSDNRGEVQGFAILQGLTSGQRSIELKRIVVRTPGQGLGRTMLQALIKMSFEEFGAHRLWLDVFESNIRARHLYESLRFVPEGILRDAVYRDGSYHSLVVMSLLDCEYADATAIRDRHPRDA